MPEATPALVRSTAFIAAVLIGDITRPDADAHRARRRGAGSRSWCRRRAATARAARPRRWIRPETISGRGPIRSVSRPAIGRDEHDHDRGGQEAHAGLERRVAEDVLHVEGDEEEHREHRERDDEGDDVRAQERPRAEEGEVDHRHARAPLDDHEGDEGHDRQGEQRQDPRPSPSPTRCPRRARARARSGPTVSVDDAGDVDALLDRLVARLARGEQRHHDGADGDRQVEEEDGAPADVLGEEAADAPGRWPARARTRRPTCRSPCRARAAGRRW